MWIKSSHRANASSATAVLITTLLVGGCAVGPRFEQPPARLPERWGASGAEKAMTLAMESEVEARWWEQFRDPILNDLIERARKQNLDLRTVALRVAQSRAQRNIVAGGRAPSVAASGSYRRQRQSELGTGTRLIDAIAGPAERDAIVDILSEPHDVYQAGFDATWELDLWGRVGRAIESAEASVAAAEADMHGAYVSVIGEVARRFLELRGIQDQLRIAQNDLAAGHDLLELTRFRANGGLVTQLDVVSQEARLAQSSARLRQLEQQEAQLIESLALLLAAEPGALRAELTVSAAPPTRPATLAVGVPSDLARRRPDIRAAEARLQAATAEVGVAVADLYPRITLTGGFGPESLNASDLGEWAARQWTIGPSLRLPIFDGGRRRGVVELRDLQQQEAAVSYQKTVLAAWHEIDSLLDLYARELQRNDELAEAVQASREAYEIATTRYGHGLTDFLVPLEAQRMLLQAESALSESNTLLATRVVALYKALGGGWD